MKKLFIAIFASALFMLSQSGNAALPQTSCLNIAETLSYSGEFQCFSRMLEQADLNKVLKGKGPYTVFAPTDAALAKLPPQVRLQLLSAQNDCQLTRTMRYHIVARPLNSQQLALSPVVKTTEGRCIGIAPGCNTLTVNNAQVVQRDIYTTNGVIHVIDNLLIPGQQLTLR